MSNDGSEVVVAHQGKWSSNDATSVVNIRDMERVLRNARESTVNFGVERDSILAVGEFWRKAPL